MIILPRPIFFLLLGCVVSGWPEISVALSSIKDGRF
jgi:hypothetical protein